MSAVVDDARPLTPDERHAVYADALSFYGERERIKRAISKLGWVAGVFGAVCITASAVGWTIMLPLKSTELRFVIYNETTGQMTNTVRADEASELFGPKGAEHMLQQYVESREGYVPETDLRHWNIVREMSTDEVFIEYNGGRKSDLSPLKQLGSSGHVLISDISFTPHGKGDNGTYEYTVRYRRQELRNGTSGPVKAFSTVIAFQWHPQAQPTVQERADNPGGMVVVAYDTPKPD